MGPKAVDGMANSVDPDQTAPLGAVWSGPTLFAKICLSENLGPLRYSYLQIISIKLDADLLWSVKGRQLMKGIYWDSFIML